MMQYQNGMIEGKYYFIIEMGKSQILRKDILCHLQKHRPGWMETHSVDVCDVILVFCPIVSRAGTDIDAALNELNTCPASKPAIFMVFHPTFDAEKIVLDSSRYIIRRNTLTVDCLFHEDKGLLKCKKNDEALTRVVHRFKPQFGEQVFGSDLLNVYAMCSTLQNSGSGVLNNIREQKKFRRIIIITVFTVSFICVIYGLSQLRRN
uniref:Uncharacterized protein n=1 Tax=Cyprinus carpio TaxID=7962 RepID=A0A8C1NV91_CYPCA